MTIKYADILRILNERYKLTQNKGISVYFDSHNEHSFSEKLKRANLNESVFRSKLNTLTTKIKKEKISSGKYSFVFKEFTLPTIYNEKIKELFISTILTPDMVVKKGDKLVHMDEEYQIVHEEI